MAFSYHDEFSVGLTSNCEVCGQECSESDLFNYKFGTIEYDACEPCCQSDDIVRNYKEAAEAIGIYEPFLQYKKAVFILNRKAQKLDDPEVTGPQVRIEPAESLIDEAVKRLKQIDSNYFSGVRKIVSGPSSGYGHVQSGPGQDPSVIHVNLQRIRSEIEQEMTGASEEEIKEVLVDAIVDTISHERAHCLSYDEEKGFVGGESPAIAEEQRIHNLNK